MPVKADQHSAQLVCSAIPWHQQPTARLCSCRWESLPPELLRRVVLQLTSDWHYTDTCRPVSSMLPVRATCRAWRAVVDSDVKQVAVTVPPLAPEYLAQNFPGITKLDLSRYEHSCQEIFPVLQQLQLRFVAVATSGLLGRSCDEMSYEVSASYMCW